MLRKLRFMFWYWLFYTALRHMQRLLYRTRNSTVEEGTCANRAWLMFDIANKLKITVTWKDKRLPDGYAREELLLMLREVRKHEAQQNWKVPDWKVPESSHEG